MRSFEIGLPFYDYILTSLDQRYKHNFRELSTDDKYIVNSLVLLKSLSIAHRFLKPRLEKYHHPSFKVYKGGKLPREYKDMYKELHIAEATSFLRNDLKGVKHHQKWDIFHKKFPKIEDFIFPIERADNKYYFRLKTQKPHEMLYIQEDGKKVVHLEYCYDLPSFFYSRAPTPMGMIREILSKPEQVHSKMQNRLFKKKYGNNPGITYNDVHKQLHIFCDKERFYDLLSKFYQTSGKVLLIQLMEAITRTTLPAVARILAKESKKIDLKDKKYPDFSKMNEGQIRSFLKNNKDEIWILGEQLGLFDHSSKLMYYHNLRNELAHPGYVDRQTVHPERIVHDIMSSDISPLAVVPSVPINIPDFLIITDYLNGMYDQIRHSDQLKGALVPFQKHKLSFKKNVEELKKSGLLTESEEEDIKKRNNIAHANGKEVKIITPEERLLRVIFESADEQRYRKMCEKGR